MIGLSFKNRKTFQFKKNRTVCLKQSNARKYNRQYKLANQHKVLMTTRQRKSRWPTVVCRRRLLLSCESRFMTVNVVVLFCVFVWAIPQGKCMAKVMKVYIGNTLGFAA